MKRRSKYGAVRTTVNGITFASEAEARRYQELLWLVKAGEIRNLHRQKAYALLIEGTDGRGHVIGRYDSDFEYDERDGSEWRHVTEDVKGVKTPVYRIKRKLMKALHGIEIRETR